MPVDEDGNRADIITGPDSVPGRMNLGRLYGPYFNAAARDVRKMMLECIGKPRNFKGKISEDEFMAIDPKKIAEAENLMLKYYDITSRHSYVEYTQNLNEEERVKWLLFIFNEALYNYFPIDGTANFSEMVKKIDAQYFSDIDPEQVKKMESQFKLTFGPVTYVGHSGKKITTFNKFRIAPIPIMLLDKIADSWLSVDTGKHSNFGILTAMNRPDKYTRPWRRTPSRVVGETEGRLYCNYGGQAFVAELLDRNGNIATQREIARNILHSENPMQIEKIVDRQKIPFGNTRPLQILNQFFYCLGIKMVYKPEIIPQAQAQYKKGGK